MSDRKFKNIILMVIMMLAGACGVKKPPTPAYAFPGEMLNGIMTSPTPGFNHPTGPLNEQPQ